MLRRYKNLPKSASYDEFGSPVGMLTLIVSKRGLHAVCWDVLQHDPDFATFIKTLKHDPSNKTIVETKKQLTEYFAGKRKTFDLPLVLDGTAFQKQAWQALINIPYGKTASYGEQAEKIGNRNKARAVGMANNKNPISIIVPCHRVIGANGALTGFAGGLDKKAQLLAFEAENA